MTPQSTFMILAPIEKHRIAALRDLLGTMNINFGQADPENELVPFGQFDRLHVARFVILEALHLRRDNQLRTLSLSMAPCARLPRGL